jgi:hypothetical protein
VIAASLLILLLLEVGGAQAGFAPANDLIATGPFPEASGIATDPRGNSLVVWAEPTTTLGPPYVPRARWLSATGQLGPVIDLALGGTGFEPKVAMAPSGRAFVAWRVAGENGPPVGAAGRWVEPDGTVDPLRTFAPPAEGELDVAELDVVVDPAGVATVGMRNQAQFMKEELAMQRVQPDSSVGPLVREVGIGIVEMQMAALPNGSTIGVWRDIGIEEAVLTKDLEVVPTAKLASTSSVFGPGIAVDSLGNGLVAWRQGNAPPFSVRGRLLDRAGAPLGSELIVEGDAPGNLGTPLNVAADSANDFLVAWSRQEGSNNSLARARTVSSSGAFTGPVQTLSAGGAVAEFPRPFLSDRGAGAVVWDRYSEMTSTTQGRTIDGAGAPTAGSLDLFSSTSNFVLASGVPAIGFAAFEIGSPSTSGAIVVRRFMEPPTCADSSATVKQGRPITVHLDCSGLAMNGVQVLSGTGHGSLGTPDAATLTVRYRPRPGFAGTDGFTFTAGNDGGSSNSAGVSIKVRKDTVRPRIKRLRLVRRKRRLRFLVRVSEPARVRIAVDRRGRKRKRIVLGRVKSRKAKRNLTIPVRGRLAKRLLAGGRFRATAIATDLARNKSRPSRLRFKLKG